MATRTITGTIYDGAGNPVSGAGVSFVMDRGTYLLDPDVHYAASSVTARTDSDGAFSVDLEGGLPVLWNVSLPSQTFVVAVPDGATITLEELRAAYTGVAPERVIDVAEIAVSSAEEGQIFAHNGTQFVNTSAAQIIGVETTPVVGVSAGMAHHFDVGGADPASIAGLFAHPMRLGTVVSRRFEDSPNPGATGDAYTAAMLVRLESAHAEPDAVALVVEAAAEVEGASAYGSNFIIRSELAATDAKLIGLEIDILPAAGTGDCAPGSSGIYLVLFGNERLGPAIVVTGSVGGRWDYGLLLNNIRADGGGVVVQAGAPEMEWGIYLNNGTYGTTAAQFGGQNDIPALILNRGVAGATADILKVQNADGSADYLRVSGAGRLRLGTNPADTGVICLPNEPGGGGIYGRNAGNSADLLMLHAGSDDRVYVANNIGATSNSVITNSGVNVNAGGLDSDTQIQGDADANLIYADASADRVGIGTATPSAKLDVNSDVIRLRNSKTPATAGAAGNAGDIAWDSSFIYVCVATNTWKRAAIATW